MKGLLLQRMTSCSLFLTVWMQTLVPMAFKRSEQRDRAELKSNKTVFSTSCCSLSATCMSSHFCTKREVPDPCPVNHILRQTKDVCHMSLRASSLQQSNTTRQFITRQMASLTLLRHYRQRVSIIGPQIAKSHPLTKFKNFVQGEKNPSKWGYSLTLA